MILHLIHQKRVSEDVWCILGFGRLHSHCVHLHRNQMVAEMFLFYLKKMDYCGVSTGSYSLMDKQCKSKVNWRKTASKITRQHIAAQPHIPQGNVLETNIALGPGTLWERVWDSHYSGKGEKERKGNLHQKHFIPLVLWRLNSTTRPRKN